MFGKYLRKIAIIMVIQTTMMLPLICQAGNKPPPKGFKFGDGWMLEWKDSSQKLEEHFNPSGDVLFTEVWCHYSDELSKDVKLCSIRESKWLPVIYKSASLFFQKDRFYLVIANFDPDSYKDIYNSLVSALGKPTQSAGGSVQNGFGAQFDQATAVWITRDVGIQLRKRSGNIDHGALIMTYLPVFQELPSEPPVTAPF